MRYVPGLRLDDGISDFLYRINRPRVSRAIPALKVNRLATWTALAIHVYALAIPMSMTVQGQEMYSVTRVELDINTSPESTVEIMKVDLPNILDELVELSLEVAEKGDVP